MPELHIEDLIIPKYDKVLFDILDHKYTHFTIPGGRGSTKSSFFGIAIPLLITQNPNVHAVCFRRYTNTLKDSVYAEIQAGISKLGLDDFFQFKTSPLEVIYKNTGQRILFRGFDKPEKIKSIKVPFGYIGITWYEELDQLPGRNGIRKATQSTMRGGEKFWNFESFNPPLTAANWANKDILVPRDDRLVASGVTYKDVPREWLGEQFIEEAEFLKSTNEKAYRHEYLGEPVGTGGMVFENVRCRQISDDEIAGFDRIYTGLDWGFVDPTALVKMHYSANQQKLYIFDECFRYKNELEELVTAMSPYKDCIITADSAEPGSIKYFQASGFNIFPAKKAAGSVLQGMRFLQRLVEIVIDPVRCPKTAAEFTEYEYLRSREGEIIEAFPDADDHGISAVRYALASVIEQRKGLKFA